MKSDRHPNGVSFVRIPDFEMTDENKMIDETVVEIATLLVKKGLTYSQASRVLDLAQSEIKECKLIY